LNCWAAALQCEFCQAFLSLSPGLYQRYGLERVVGAAACRPASATREPSEWSRSYICL